MNWESPLLGRRVKVLVWEDGQLISKSKHWWQNDKRERGKWVWEEGEVVDRSSSSEYLVAFDDGSMDWYWSDDIRMVKKDG